MAAALLVRGVEKVAVVERGLVTGRDQEWNISRKVMGGRPGVKHE